MALQTKSQALSINIGIVAESDSGDDIIIHLLNRYTALPVRNEMEFAFARDDNSSLLSLRMVVSERDDTPFSEYQNAIMFNIDHPGLVHSNPICVSVAYDINANLSLEVRCKKNESKENSQYQLVHASSHSFEEILEEYNGFRYSGTLRVVHNEPVPLLDDPQNVTPHAKGGHLDALLATVPKDAAYLVQAGRFAELSHEFRQQMAMKLGPSLNSYLREHFPHDDLEGKKRLCEFVAETLVPLGLAVKAPNTANVPAQLKTHPGSWPKIGRFLFETYVDGKRKMTYSDKLPELELTDALPAKLSETVWEEKVGPRSGRTGRKMS